MMVMVMMMIIIIIIKIKGKTGIWFTLPIISRVLEGTGGSEEQDEGGGGAVDGKTGGCDGENGVERENHCYETKIRLLVRGRPSIRF